MSNPVVCLLFNHKLVKPRPILISFYPECVVWCMLKIFFYLQWRAATVAGVAGKMLNPREPLQEASLTRLLLPIIQNSFETACVESKQALSAGCLSAEWILLGRLFQLGLFLSWCQEVWLIVLWSYVWSLTADPTWQSECALFVNVMLFLGWLGVPLHVGILVLFLQ